MTFILPILPYSYDEFEPFFDKETMRIHHIKHHQTYINNANFALKNIETFNNLTVETLIKQLKFVPNEQRMPLRNNAGGHINHNLFWTFLKKNSILEGKLKEAIEHNFDSIQNFKEKFEMCAINRFGSGWIWLVKKHDHTLNIISTANQDNPLMGKEISGEEYSYPLLGLDVWEHAYYLKYQNKRLDYVKSFWNIVNWEEVSKRFNHLF